jgi:hypothetical protein
MTPLRGGPAGGSRLSPGTVGAIGAPPDAAGDSSLGLGTLKISRQGDRGFGPPGDRKEDRRDQQEALASLAVQGVTTLIELVTPVTP